MDYMHSIVNHFLRKSFLKIWIPTLQILDLNDNSLITDFIFLKFKLFVNLY